MSQKLAYGGGASGGIFTNNPKDLPLVLSNYLYLKTDLALVDYSTTATFYTALALRGAQGAITVADTYVTLCDLTGSGLLCNVVCPMHSAEYTTTLRVTVDGVVSTFTVASVTAAHRLLLGCYTNFYSNTNATAYPSNFFGPNTVTDPGFKLALLGGVPVTQNGDSRAVTLPTPEQALLAGMPLLRFETGLKVEVKASLLSATAVHKQCGVTYRLDV